MAKQTIGEFLATQRKAKGYTQQYVADFLGISNKTLSAWETNKAYPDILTIPALAELYGVTCDEIINGERSTEIKSAEPEISEKAQSKLFKRKLAKNAPKHTALLSAGIFGAIMFGLGVVIIFLTSIIFWFNILLIVLGLIITMVVCTLIAVLIKSTITTADIYSEEPTLTERNFIISAVCQGVRLSDIIAFVWLGCGCFVGLLCFIDFIGDIGEWDYGYYEDPVPFIAWFLLIFFIHAVIAFTILITANISKVKNIKRYGTEEQIKFLKYNRKLLAICSVSIIPFLVFTVFFAVCLLFTDLAFAAVATYSCFFASLLCIAVGITVYCIKRKKLKFTI